MRQGLFGGLDKQGLGALEKGLGSLWPAARFEIPVEWLHTMALDDAGIGEDARKRFELRQTRPEHVPRRGQHVFL